MPPSSPGAARLPIPAVGWGAPSSWAPRGELGRETEPRACPRGSGGACLWPLLLSCPSVMSPPAQPLPSLPRLPDGALGGPGLRLSASPSFCVRPATLSLCWLPGGGGVPRVWGNAAGLFLRPAQKGRASCVSSLWCSQAEGGTESPPGPPVLAQGQQAGLEGTKGFLHPPPSLPGGPWSGAASRLGLPLPSLAALGVPSPG